MATVNLWGALRPAANGDASIELEASTIRELMNKLEERYPLMSQQIDAGIAVSIDGTIYQDAWSQVIPTDAEIYLLPRIPGG
ncbi:MAG: MoaD/ThiS family protein [Gammaproteobacteria bacterium]|nr:MoaD/ThiS family protein [Gammaproteobacteria bacterium]